MNIQRMQTTIKHTRTEINAHATNYGSSNGFAAFHFFFFFPNSFIFRTNFLHLAWNIARINYAILLQILRSNFSTFQINLFLRHPSYVPLTSLLQRPS